MKNKGAKDIVDRMHGGDLTQEVYDDIGRALRKGCGEPWPAYRIGLYDGADQALREFAVPYFSVSDEGVVALVWPDETQYVARVNRALLEQVAIDKNETTARIRAQERRLAAEESISYLLHTQLEEARAQIEHLEGEIRYLTTGEES